MLLFVLLIYNIPLTISSASIPASLAYKLTSPSSSYDKNQPPLLDSPTDVTVQVIVKKISNVKEDDLSYKIKYDFHMEWRDGRLNWSEPTDFVLDHMWGAGIRVR